jgi:hypothetical protein
VPPAESTKSVPVVYYDRPPRTDGRICYTPIPSQDLCCFLWQCDIGQPLKINICKELVTIDGSWVTFTFTKEKGLALAKSTFGQNASIEFLKDLPLQLPQISGYLETILGFSTIFLFGKEWLPSPLADEFPGIDIDMSGDAFKLLFNYSVNGGIFDPDGHS